ncbi:hypothetical protein TNCV_1498221 [Trichonephila clavipes]|nr:hypothetical protein TNCV_1498221 [Trichonephila clavipes]
MEQKKEEMIPRKKRLPLKERNPVIKKKPAIKEELIVKEVEMEVLSWVDNEYQACLGTEYWGFFIQLIT